LDEACQFRNDEIAPTVPLIESHIDRANAIVLWPSGDLVPDYRRPDYRRQAIGQPKNDVLNDTKSG